MSENVATYGRELLPSERLTTYLTCGIRDLNTSSCKQRTVSRYLGYLLTATKLLIHFVCDPVKNPSGGILHKILGIQPVFFASYSLVN